MNNHLVIGLGEVGSAIKSILECDGLDIYKSVYPTEDLYGILHICFPYTESFESDVIHYREKYGATLVIIHSTVPIGTSEKLEAVHSPVRGIHPDLEKGIRTFVKYFGGARAFEAAQFFVSKGILCKVVDHSRDTEAAKLWDTTQYGAMILLEKEIHSFCEKNGLDFDLIYGDFNQTYNAGYQALGMPHVVRPYLKHIEGPIGGHCVIPNAKLLDSPTATRIVE